MYVCVYIRVCEYVVGVNVSWIQCLLVACKGHAALANSLKHRPPRPPSEGSDWFGRGTGSSARPSPLGNPLGWDLRVPAAGCKARGDQAAPCPPLHPQDVAQSHI